MAKSKLLYVMDPFCGWCYAMSPQISRLQKTLAGEIDFQLVLGGMLVGERVGPMQADKSKMILDAIPNLEKVAGIKIGEAFKNSLRVGSYYGDSTPPSRALSAVRSYSPQHLWTFLKSLQNQLFQNGTDLRKDSTYQKICEELGLDYASFQMAYQSQSSVDQAFADYSQVQAWGISGFPMVLWDDGKQIVGLAQGFATSEQILSRIHQISNG